MSFSKEDAIEKARADLGQRLGVATSKIKQLSVEDAEFPDMAMGAATKGEMSGQMITSGWRILLQVENQTLEYRANKNQIRLYNYQGRNYRV